VTSVIRSGTEAMGFGTVSVRSPGIWARGRRAVLLWRTSIRFCSRNTTIRTSYRSASLRRRWTSAKRSRLEWFATWRKWPASLPTSRCTRLPLMQTHLIRTGPISLIFASSVFGRVRSRLGARCPRVSGLRHSYKFGIGSCGDFTRRKLRRFHVLVLRMTGRAELGN
jgi:hypothetical protein